MRCYTGDSYHVQQLLIALDDTLKTLEKEAEADIETLRADTIQIREALFNKSKVIVDNTVYDALQTIKKVSERLIERGLDATTCVDGKPKQILDVPADAYLELEKCLHERREEWDEAAERGYQKVIALSLQVDALDKNFESCNGISSCVTHQIQSGTVTLHTLPIDKNLILRTMKTALDEVVGKDLDCFGVADDAVKKIAVIVDEVNNCLFNMMEMFNPM